MAIKFTPENVRIGIYGAVLVLTVGSIPGYSRMMDDVLFYVATLGIHAGNFIILRCVFLFWDRGWRGTALMGIVPVIFISTLNALLTAGFIYQQFFYTGA